MGLRSHVRLGSLGEREEAPDKQTLMQINSEQQILN